jgi:ERCC4-type nuclease
MGRRRKFGTSLPGLRLARKEQDMRKKYLRAPGKRVTQLGLKPRTAKSLEDSGLRSGSVLQESTLVEIMSVKGIGPSEADKIRRSVGQETPLGKLRREYRKALSQRREMRAWKANEHGR